MTYVSLQALGEQVRLSRMARHMRQVDLAKTAGVSRYTVIKLERGQLADINFKTLTAIVQALGLELRLMAQAPSGLPVLGEP